MSPEASRSDLFLGKPPSAESRMNLRMISRPQDTESTAYPVRMLMALESRVVSRPALTVTSVSCTTVSPWTNGVVDDVCEMDLSMRPDEPATWQSAEHGGCCVPPQAGEYIKTQTATHPDSPVYILAQES